MKKVLLLAIIVFFSTSINAQLLKRLGDRAKSKVEQKAGEKVDKGIDNAVDGKKKTETSEGEVKEKTEDGETKVKTESKNTALKSYSKFDFVPGDKILYAEDFAQDVVGEFPLKWNTNGSGEVVTVEGVAGKWLQLSEGTFYTSPYKKTYPENYTVEFDVLADYKAGQRIPNLSVKLMGDKKTSYNIPGIDIVLAPNDGTNAPESKDAIYLRSYDMAGKMHLDASKQLYSTFSDLNKTSTPIHIAIWVQKQRVRVWVNERKMYDLPRGIAPEAILNALQFDLENYGGSRDNYNFLISNIKIAAASPDTRSKLITEGRWSTNGILFDVNSDKIKPVSYGVLKDIATTLKENPEVRVRIIGHTDSDGDEAKNKELSEKRAASVRIVLTTEFGIEGTRFETGGMGESKPLADNKTAEGKAQNRRVEFVKL